MKWSIKDFFGKEDPDKPTTRLGKLYYNAMPLRKEWLDEVRRYLHIFLQVEHGQTGWDKIDKILEIDPYLEQAAEEEWHPRLFAKEVTKRIANVYGTDILRYTYREDGEDEISKMSNERLFGLKR